MPYNIDPIPPNEDLTGQTSLPLARVKRIIKLDDEISACSNSASFLVTVAAEMFIQYLSKQGFKGAQKDRRKVLQYKDLANAVAALDTLEFLSDTIPRTVPYRKIVTRKVVPGEGIRLNGGGTVRREEDEDEDEEDGDEEQYVEEEREEEDGSRDVSMDVESIGQNGLGSDGYGHVQGKRKLSEEGEDEEMS